MQFIKNHLKNISGWKTNRKLLVINADDYGNVRLKNLETRELLKSEGVKIESRFDKFDSLDTKEDFEILFETLSSVKDKNGNFAKLTPYAVSCNIDFKRTLENNICVLERLDATYAKLESDDQHYRGAFKLMLEGISQGLIKPQFHGREHLNINLINKHLEDHTKILLKNLENYSLVGIPNLENRPTVGFTQSFAFWNPEEIPEHRNIIYDGLNLFKEVYGYCSITFTPPAQQLHPSLYKYLPEVGVIGLDKPRTMRRHQGNGKFSIEKNKLELDKTTGLVNLIRNCVFEPTEGKRDWVKYTLKQIETAFFWNKPAIISTHRVNFCGRVSAENRQVGIIALKELLKKIKHRWPEIEFITADELAQIISKDVK